MLLKNNIWFYLVLFMTAQLSFTQEWMTSLSFAERLALVQNKMLFVMWEESTLYPFPVQFTDDKGNLVLTDLFEDEQVNQILWDHFVPVMIPEFQYEELFAKIDGKRLANYINKFNDDSIKVMDANGNILNVNESNTGLLDLSDFINRYAFNTVYLQPNLMSYRENKNSVSAIRLALAYYDFAIFNKKDIKKEIINLGNIYLEEANAFLETEQLEDKQVVQQRNQLHELKQYLVLDRPKKVLRDLKKMKDEQILDQNVPLHAFLNYTAYKMLGKDKDADIWKSDVSLVDLKKAELIINSTN